VDVAKRLTFRIRGGMLMMGRLNTKGECSQKGGKKVAATGGYSTNRKIFNRYSMRCIFQSKL
jgi:hypothetical protein